MSASETPRTWQELYGENDVGHFRRSVEMTKGEFAAADRWWSDCVRRGNEEKYAAEYVAWRELAAARADADSWERQNSDRVGDCVKLIAERDALRDALTDIAKQAAIMRGDWDSRSSGPAALTIVINRAQLALRRTK